MREPTGEQKTVYLSGPMTGLPEANHPAFFEYERRLVTAGWVVVNPARINPPSDRPASEEARASCIWRDLKAVRACDCLAAMPGWPKSIGARAEMFLARSLNHLIFDIETGEEIIVE